MSEDRRTVVVGLDVHKSSVRLAAVRDGALLREITLGYDHEQLLGEVRAFCLLADARTLNARLHQTRGRSKPPSQPAWLIVPCS
jgi:hypothetical protein